MESSEQKSYTIRKIKEKIFLSLAGIFTLLAILPLIFLLSYVFYKGVSSINLDFFIHLPAPVGEAGGGMGNAIAGTVLIVLIGCIFSIPIGIFGGLWLAESGKGKAGFIIRYCVDVMSGIPTIVFGIFAYVIFVLPFKHFSAFAGGFALALIMIPYMVKTTEEMVKLVPRSLKESALALGIEEWRVSLSIILRTAWSGIFSGVMLAVARAAGETAPLLFTAFTSSYWNFRIDQPMASMTVQIYNYAISPFDDWNRMAWAGALVLVAMVLIVTLVVRKFSKRVIYV